MQQTHSLIGTRTDLVQQIDQLVQHHQGVVHGRLGSLFQQTVKALQIILPDPHWPNNKIVVFQIKIKGTPSKNVAP
jgi:hypothetical protein